MGKWIEYCKGLIPNGKYETSIEFGEKNGLVVKLFNCDICVKIEFGNVNSFRVLDEGCVQMDIYNEKEVNKYKYDGFSNMIYKVEGEEYESYIKRIAGGYADVGNCYHFVIITQNYNIDIITEYLPELYTNKKG